VDDVEESEGALVGLPTPPPGWQNRLTPPPWTDVLARCLHSHDRSPPDDPVLRYWSRWASA